MNGAVVASTLLTFILCRKTLFLTSIALNNSRFTHGIEHSESSSFRSLSSASDTKLWRRNEFTDQCTEYLTVTAGGDGLASNKDVAAFLTIISDDKYDFFNLPTEYQIWFIMSICRGEDRSSCVESLEQKSTQGLEFGFSSDKFEYVDNYCFQLFHDVAEDGIIDTFETPSPSPAQTNTATMFPSFTPSQGPNYAPAFAPVFSPTQHPTASPTKTPSRSPTFSPTQTLTEIPTNFPTDSPSEFPTYQPSFVTTFTPTLRPTTQPTPVPSNRPSVGPTHKPSKHPSIFPTSNPSLKPSPLPSPWPSIYSSSIPSSKPTSNPTFSSPAPSGEQTYYPTFSSPPPSGEQTYYPTFSSPPPSGEQTYYPTFSSSSPSGAMSAIPSSRPSSQLSARPSSQLSARPSSRLSTQRPSFLPSRQPLTFPSTAVLLTPSPTVLFSSINPTNTPFSSLFAPTESPSETSTFATSSSFSNGDSSRPLKDYTIFSYRIHFSRDLSANDVEEETNNFVLGDLMTGFETLFQEFKVQEQNVRYLRVMGGGLELNNLYYRDVDCEEEAIAGTVSCVLITSEVKVTSKQSDSLQDMDEILLATAQNAMSPVSSNLVEIVNNPDIIEIVFVQTGTITDTFVGGINDTEESKAPMDDLGVAGVVVGSSFFICASIVLVGKHRRRRITDDEKLFTAYTEDNIDSDETSEWGNISPKKKPYGGNILERSSPDLQKVSKISAQSRAQNSVVHSYAHEASIDSPATSKQHTANNSLDISRTINSLQDALKDMNAALKVSDYGTVAKIAGDMSSANDTLSSISSNQSHIVGKNEHFASLLPAISPAGKDSKNLTEEERRRNLDYLIQAGDWDAVAAASAMYESDASTVASRVSKPSADPKTKDNRKRPFLDYVVGRPRSSAAANAAIENSTDVEMNSTSSRDHSQVWNKSSNHESNLVEHDVIDNEKGIMKADEELFPSSIAHINQFDSVDDLNSNPGNFNFVGGSRLGATARAPPISYSDVKLRSPPPRSKGSSDDSAPLFGVKLRPVAARTNDGSGSTDSPSSFGVELRQATSTFLSDDQSSTQFSLGSLLAPLEKNLSTDIGNDNDSTKQPDLVSLGVSPAVISPSVSSDKTINDSDWEEIGKHVSRMLNFSSTDLEKLEAASVSSRRTFISEAYSEMNRTSDSSVMLSVDDDEKIQMLESFIEADDWKGLKGLVETNEQRNTTSDVSSTNASLPLNQSEILDDDIHDASSSHDKSSLTFSNIEKSDWAISNCLNDLHEHLAAEEQATRKEDEESTNKII